MKIAALLIGLVMSMGTILIQNNVIIGQQNLIQQMMTNPACMVGGK